MSTGLLTSTLFATVEENVKQKVGGSGSTMKKRNLQIIVDHDENTSVYTNNLGITFKQPLKYFTPQNMKIETFKFPSQKGK